MIARRTGRVSLDRPGSGKWTSIFSPTRYCATGPALRISTAKPTVCTAGCELVLNNGNFLKSNGERFLASGYGCVPHAKWPSSYGTTVLPNGAHVRYKGEDGLWWLGKISASTTTDGEYLAQFLDESGPI